MLPSFRSALRENAMASSCSQLARRVNATACGTTAMRDRQIIYADGSNRRPLYRRAGCRVRQHDPGQSRKVLLAGFTLDPNGLGSSNAPRLGLKLGHPSIITDFSAILHDAAGPPPVWLVAGMFG